MARAAFPIRPLVGLELDREGDQVNSPLSSAGRVTVRGGEQVPCSGYWFEPSTNWVRYFDRGQAAPEGVWAFVTETYNLSRPQLRALIEQLGLYVGDVSDIKFE